jgi:hypothetical protein
MVSFCVNKIDHHRGVVVVGAHNFFLPIHGFIDHHCGVAIVGGHNFFDCVHHLILCRHHHRNP